jgi:DNA modification methylase
MMHTNVVLPVLPDRFEYKLDLGPTATARELKNAPRHRWFYFPHSFSPRLVFQLLDSWNLPARSKVVDNFVGSGTTLLACRERGMACQGFDLSPLAVMVSNTKTISYQSEQLLNLLDRIPNPNARAVQTDFAYPDRLLKAFTAEELGVLSPLSNSIKKLHNPERGFFFLSLLWTAHSFSRAIPDGGWFRWAEWPDQSEKLLESFKNNCRSMIGDIRAVNWQNSDLIYEAKRADARKLPVDDTSVDAVITSPPYANRHDYSRIFHIDLLLSGLSEEGVTRLRHGAVRSNVEAKYPEGYKRKLSHYEEPDSLVAILNQIPDEADERIVPLLKGYFQDMYLSLLEVARILRTDGHVAYVIGNVRHGGVMIPVDEILGEIAPQVGLEFERAWVLRRRGNSAQQMDEYGRDPSRETVVILRKP